MINHYRMQEASEINSAISALPIANSFPVNVGTLNMPAEGYQAIVSVDRATKAASIVNIARMRYHIVQHEDAFRPIIEGMTIAGLQDFKFILTSQPHRAHLQVFTGQKASVEGTEGISLGVNALNTFDGTKPLTYSITLFSEKNTIELVGYRQVCSNGMKIRVPLDKAEIIREEEVSELRKLWDKEARILHTPSADIKIKSLQYVMEAVTMLTKPVENLIKKAKEFSLKDTAVFEEIIKAYVGKRYAARVVANMNTKDIAPEDHGSLWALYNAMTYVASHDDEIEDTSRETLLNKAADLLLIPVRGN